MKKSLWLPVMLAIAAFVAGCNTMEGAGEDIEAGAGETDEQRQQEADPEELDDEHRLTELYGMPAEPHDAARAADDRTMPPADPR